MPSLQQLTIVAAIVHRVPRRLTKAAQAHGQAEPPPELTDKPVDLSPELEAFLKRRLVATMTNAFEVRFDPNADTTMAGLMAASLGDPQAQLTTQSPGMAVHLHTIQDASNPEGLLVAMHGDVAARRFVAVMKLEQERGVHSHLETLPDGSRQFKLDIQPHVLGEKTRVFKAGLFFLPAGHHGGAAVNEQAIEGWISDDQAGRNGDPVAHFFRYEYLGCEYSANKALQTRQFFNAAEDFVNSIEDGETRARYEVALLAEMGSPKATVTPKTFAQNNLEADDQQPFLDHLLGAGAATTQFAKDNELIKNRIRVTHITTKTDVKVIATAAHIEEGTVLIEAGGDGETGKILIQDDVSEIRGR